MIQDKKRSKFSSFLDFYSITSPFFIWKFHFEATPHALCQSFIWTFYDRMNYQNGFFPSEKISNHLRYISIEWEYVEEKTLCITIRLWIYSRGLVSSKITKVCLGFPRKKNRSKLYFFSKPIRLSVLEFSQNIFQPYSVPPNPVWNMTSIERNEMVPFFPTTSSELEAFISIVFFKKYLWLGNIWTGWKKNIIQEYDKGGLAIVIRFDVNPKRRYFMGQYLFKKGNVWR